jgi:hypothetical protein
MFIMPVFKDQAEMQTTLTALFTALRDHPEIGPRVQASGLVVRFSYTNPDGFVVIDCRQKPVGVRWDKVPDLTPEERTKTYVEMSMDADTAHYFWLGKVNLVAAITRGIIKVKGPIPSIMRLLPIIKPAFEIYPRVLQADALQHPAR